MKQIKIFKQETNKSCGVACLRSILNYYGNDFSEKDIWDEKDHYGSGDKIRSSPISLGVTALKFGFKVTYFGENYILSYNNKFDDLEKSLKEKSKDYFDYGKYLVDKALYFLNLGGKIKLELLNINKIKRILDKHKFALVEIVPASIRKNGNINMRHKIILIGYTKKGFRILDPGNAKEEIYNFDDFLLSFYQAGAELLIINKNGK
jgi:hypothetical protein